jgi:hypothetical protein
MLTDTCPIGTDCTTSEHKESGGGVSRSRDVTWLAWNHHRLDPKKYPELAKLPIGFDDVDIPPTNVPETRDSHSTR